VEQGNRAAIKRLPRAQVIAEAKEWQCLGDERDTWLIPSSRGEKTYQVNGRCACPDFQHNGVPGGWCKHRLARGLAKRAAEILKEDPSTAPASIQARRIDLIVGYEADEARVLPRTNANGQLIQFTVDGKLTSPPVPTMPQLYRWLQAEGYVPEGFRWMGWERGLRQRRESYVMEVIQ
jgi:hypothetical protein